MNQQRGRREPVVVIREMRLLLGSARKIREKLLERLEHAGSDTYGCPGLRMNRMYRAPRSIVLGRSH